MFARILNRAAFWSIITTRVVYAVNWFNIASIFSVMALDFGQGVSGLGILTSTLYLSIGLFQVPSGILSAKFGPRITIVSGTFITSFAVLLSSLATHFVEIIILRFIAGAGMGLGYSPGIILIAKYYKKGAEGLGIGLYNWAFYLGGAIGIFGWAILAIGIGWRPSLMVSGSLGIVGTLMLVRFVPKEEITEQVGIRVGELKGILFERELLLLVMCGLGLTIGATLVQNFVVFYLNRTFALPLTIAGMIGSLFLVAEIFASPIGGWIHDNHKEFKLILFLIGCTLAGAVAIMGVRGLTGPIVSTVMGGFACGLGWTLTLATARETNKSPSKYQGLRFGWINGISLTAAFLPPVLFSNLASNIGYGYAWLSGGILTFVFVATILLSRPLLPDEDYSSA